MIASVARVLANISPIVIVVLFSKLTTVEVLGELNYFIALITIVGVFSDFGIPEAVQTYLPKLTGRRTVTPYLVMEFALVAITAVGIYLIDTMTSGQVAHGQLQMLVVLSLASAANTVIIVFNGLLQRMRMSVYYLVSAVLLLSVTFGLYFTGFNPVDAFLWGRLVSWVVMLIVPLLDLYAQGLLAWGWQLPFEQLRFTFNNFLVRAFYTLTFQWDTLLVSFASGAYVTGYFRTVALAANLPLILGTLISTKLLPELSLMAHKHEYKRMMHTYRQTLVAVFGLGAVAVSASIPLANWGLRLLFNTEIADAGSSAFVLLFLGAWLYVLAVPALTVLQALARDRILVLFAGLQAVGFVGLSTLIYPQLGLASIPALLIGTNALLALALIASVHYLLTKATLAAENLTR